MTQFKGQAGRLLDYLQKRQTAETIELRRVCDVGNVSGTARRINARLASAGDSRRIVCQSMGRSGLWRIDELDAA